MVCIVGLVPAKGKGSASTALADVRLMGSTTPDDAVPLVCRDAATWPLEDRAPR
jgi:hypothetical protein